LNAVALSVRPFLNSTGLYLARGWVLYTFRHQRAKLVAFSVWALVFIMLPVVGYRAGSAAASPVPTKPTPVVRQVQMSPPPPTQVVQAATVAPPAPPPTPVVKTYSAARSNGYTYGTYYVANRRDIPRNWGNARSWLASAKRAGFATGSAPRVGAIAWTSMGYYGHVAIVEEVSGARVRISEMNYNGWNHVSTRWTSASEFQYIY
jgi:surface antigen